MSTSWEVSANLVYVLSIGLATINSAHTWWTGIVGCLLFGWVFLQANLYADVTLQIFFIGTSLFGWWNWVRGNQGAPVPIQRSTLPVLMGWMACAIACALAYGTLLHAYTDAYAPFIDSLLLAFSVLAQFLLMQRRVETWWCWLLVNTIAVPLYLSRDLYVTAFFYAAFWVNACIALVRWYAVLGSRTAKQPLVEQTSAS